jgi:hypothetical protein
MVIIIGNYRLSWLKLGWHLKKETKNASFIFLTTHSSWSSFDIETGTLHILRDTQKIDPIHLQRILLQVPANFTLKPLYPEETAGGTNWTEGWVGLKIGLDTSKNKRIQN